MKWIIFGLGTAMFIFGCMLMSGPWKDNNNARAGLAFTTTGAALMTIEAIEA